MADLPSITVTTVSAAHVTATLRGELDGAAVAELEQALRPFDRFHVLLDMSAVTFIDSSALQYLLQLAEQCRRNGGSVTVESPARVVTRLFDITGAGRALLAP